ncbi:MAG: hypothetical protein K6B43_02385 [Treponema sp.]|nr:hypothetical protein [Treponema sp.]
MKDLITEFLDKSVIDSLSTFLTSSKSDEICKAASTVVSSFSSSEFKCASVEEEKKLISSFKRNLSLLVEKTWIEQVDISLKEEVLYKLDKYCCEIEKDNWAQSYQPFLKILNDVVYLMFGSQAKTSDFGEYALRIDPEFGIFCWYLRNLPENNNWSEEKNKVAQCVALFFLANY